MLRPFFEKQLDISGYNASLFPQSDGYIGLARLVTYKVRGIYPECTNHLVAFKLDKDFHTLHSKKLVDSTERIRHKNWTEGFEDPRLLSPSTALVVTCDTNSDWKTDVSMIEFNDFAITHVTPIRIFSHPPQNQKNWLFLRPFDSDHDDYLYRSFPFQILRINKTSKTGNIVKTFTTGHTFISHNGCVIQTEEGFLLTCRIKKNYDYHYSLWVFLDHDYNVTKISQPFWFSKAIVQNSDGSYPTAPYEMAMSIHREESDVVVCVSIADRDVFVQKYTYTDLLSIA